MGMYAEYIRITPGLLDKFIADPSLIEVMEEIDELEDADIPNEFEGEQFARVNIDKAWHGIHYLLTGKSFGGQPPFAAVVYGGKALIDTLYEDLRYLTPEEVADISKALTSLPSTELKRRYNPVAMEEADIYPHIWERDGEGAIGFLIDNYEVLVNFYREAAEEGDAMLITIGWSLGCKDKEAS